MGGPLAIKIESLQYNFFRENIISNLCLKEMFKDFMEIGWMNAS